MVLQLIQKGKVPFYLQLKEMLQQEILQEEIVNEKGNLFPMRKLACRYGVSLITVSKAVNELVEDGILYCRQGKGVYLTENANNRIKAFLANITIGAPFLDIYNFKTPYLQEVFKGIGKASSKLNLNLQIFTTPAQEINPEQNPLLWQNLKEKRINGLILTSRMPARDIVLLQEEKIPFVWIGNDLPFEKIYTVLPDNPSIVSLALSHLASHNHRRIGLIQFWWDTTTLAVYRNQLTERGMDTDPSLIKNVEIGTGKEKRTLSYQRTKELLILHPRPTALILGGETTISGALTAILEEKLKIPEDIAIIGLCSSLENHFPIPLTIVKTPVFRMAERSVEMLYRVIKKEKIPQPKVIIKPKLFIRPFLRM